MPQVINSIQTELDNTSTQVGALCELLEAASDRPVTASAIHALLEPMARRLHSMAGDLSDHVTLRGK